MCLFAIHLRSTWADGRIVAFPRASQFCFTNFLDIVASFMQSFGATSNCTRKLTLLLRSERRSHIVLLKIVFCLEKRIKCGHDVLVGWHFHIHSIWLSLFHVLHWVTQSSFIHFQIMLQIYTQQTAVAIFVLHCFSNIHWRWYSRIICCCCCHLKYFSLLFCWHQKQKILVNEFSLGRWQRRRR